MPLIKALGSLKFALFLIASLVALLTVSTFMESAYGTPLAQKIFYTAGWFDIFLSLVWLNIFFATLSRWPFKKHHLGFVVTHIGILLLLFGALLSRALGVEGQMTLFEGEQKSHILQEGYALTLAGPDGQTSRFDLRPNKKTPFDLASPRGDMKLRVLRRIDHAVQTKTLEEGGPGTPANHAVQGTLSSDTVGLKETFVLIEKDPFDGNSAVKQIGPARVELKTGPAGGIAEPVGVPLLHISQRATGRTFDLPLKEGEAGMPLADSGLTVSNMRYYPQAKVKDNKIINSPEDMHFNPAVEFEVSDAQGRREHHTKFYLFPAYGSLRGGAKNDIFGLAVELETPLPEDLRAPAAAALVFHADGDAWSYQISSSRKGASPAAPLKLGEKIATSWMDIALEAHHTFNRVQVIKTVKEDKNSDTPAVELLFQPVNGPEKRLWLIGGDPQTVETGQGAWQAALELKSVAVPFRLQLRDFRKKDYPGTANPASFESDVVVSHFDGDGPDVLFKTISMNKPLDHQGYRVFQSSYIQDETLGEASVFTVAKNPGIRFIYSGALIILTGVLMLFYLHPFFSRRAAIAARRDGLRSARRRRARPGQTRNATR